MLVAKWTTTVDSSRQHAVNEWMHRVKELACCSRTDAALAQALLLFG